MGRKCFPNKIAERKVKKIEKLKEKVHNRRGLYNKALGEYESAQNKLKQYYLDCGIPI